jgi:hypothetical protein
VVYLFPDKTTTPGGEPTGIPVREYAANMLLLRLARRFPNCVRKFDSCRGVISVDAAAGDYLHGKEGVDGSSPSEGSAKTPQKRRFYFYPTCTIINMRWVWSPLWNPQPKAGEANTPVSDRTSPNAVAAELHEVKPEAWRASPAAKERAPHGAVRCSGSILPQAGLPPHRSGSRTSDDANPPWTESSPCWKSSSSSERIDRTAGSSS